MVLASIVCDPRAFARSDSYTIILGLLCQAASTGCLFFLDDPAVNGLGDGFPSDSFPSHGNFYSLAVGIRTHN
ncbi:unnamed protein product [Musa acuminata subsp. malaccensis]|uniref:(wild Malaysian banana) hypothetical protein n=1 Tax=Musa acuminata subsp. malaccensis TaxID=214687 RepID=A0A804KY86_MUSAM|nr:unnamed protein product [Musa acuminata subsp. malaccensis]